MTITRAYLRKQLLKSSPVSYLRERALRLPRAIWRSTIVVGLATTVWAYDVELRDLDISDWGCLDQLSGTAKGQDRIERNEMKNRSPIDTAGMQFPSLDWNAFLDVVRTYDQQLGSSHRSELSKDERRQLFRFEDRTVSLTGWLVVAYPGPGETCNCGDKAHHDWHLEVFENPLDHPPSIGDPTGIVCEISPRTEQIVYQSGIRIQDLAAYIRLANKTAKATGHAAHKIRVTGFVLWDDEHNEKGDTGDVGPEIRTKGANGYYHPWRETAWEIHPAFAIEDLGTE